LAQKQAPILLGQIETLLQDLSAKPKPSGSDKRKRGRRP
jgi:hypothetical protein